MEYLPGVGPSKFIFGTFALKSCNLLGTWISATSYDDACEVIEGWIADERSNYVCLANVHMMVEAHDKPQYQSVLNTAGLVTPDGMPIVWYLKRHGFPAQSRVCGHELMPAILRTAAKKGWKVGLYGGDQETLDKLVPILGDEYPGLELPYVYSPPFRTLDADEVQAIRDDINAKNVDVLFVALGCPKQEIWMSEQQPFLRCTMVGVGAAFPFLAKTVKKAPKVLQRAGLEWLYRFAMEPKRLWKRYMTTNPRFVFLLLTSRLRKSPASKPS